MCNTDIHQVMHRCMYCTLDLFATSDHVKSTIQRMTGCQNKCQAQLSTF